jgi:hypothetical protein
MRYGRGDVVGRRGTVGCSHTQSRLHVYTAWYPHPAEAVCVCVGGGGVRDHRAHLFNNGQRLNESDMRALRPAGTRRKAAGASRWRGQTRGAGRHMGRRAPLNLIGSQLCIPAARRGTAHARQVR